MTYRVMFVDDDALPAEQGWAVATTPTAQYAFIKRSAVTPQTVAQIWAAARAGRDRRHLRIA